MSRMADGEEVTMDHSELGDLFAHPDGTSVFARMPIDTFRHFLSKADAVYYEDDAPRTSGRRRNMRWGNYSARDHESARPFVSVGVRFFPRLVREIVNLGGEAWTWHEDYLARALDRHCYIVMERLRILAKQNLAEEVQWPEMIRREKVRQYFVHPYGGPSVGGGKYEHLHRAWRWGARINAEAEKSEESNGR